MDQKVRSTLVEMNRKRKIRTQVLKGSHQKVKNVSKRIKAKLKLKEISNTVQEYTSRIPDCSVECTRSFCSELFPFVKLMRKYSLRRFLLSDFLAGLTVGIIHIPQGMAYGFLANLPPVYGLYTSFLPVITYFFFGSSKHISMGTFAVTSLMVGAVVQRGVALHGGKLVPEAGNSSLATTAVTVLHNSNFTGNGTETTESEAQTDFYAIHVAYAMSVTFVIGVFQLILGACRLGFLASFLSDPLISGFTTGAAVHVFSSQVNHLLGVYVEQRHGPLKLLYFYRDFFQNIHTVNPVTATASVTCFFILILVKEGINNNPNCQADLPAPIPIEFIVVIASTIISHYTKIETEFQVDVVGNIRQGLPPANIENLRFVGDVIGDGIIIGFVAFSISYAMAKILADKNNYTVSPNQELVANGMCNLFGSAFSCFCSAASLTRSLVQEASGGHTQMVGLFSSVLVLVVLLYIGPLFSALPNCILACVVIITLRGMFQQIQQMTVLWRLCKRDFAVWFVTFIATVVLDVALGLMVGIVFALFFVIRNSQKPHVCILGKIPGTASYKDVKTNRRVIEIPGIKIFRFESSLYFANAEQFRDRLYDRTGLNPIKLKCKKQKALYKALLLKKREQELAEVEAELKAKDNKKEVERRKNAIEIEIEEEVPEDWTEDHEKLLAKEKKEIVELFSKAWIAPIHTLIIDCTVINYIDTVAIKILAQIVNDFKEVGIKVFLAGCREETRTILKKADFYHEVDYNCLYYTVHEAVVISQEIHSHIIKANPKYLKMIKEEFGDSLPDPPNGGVADESESKV